MTNEPKTTPPTRKGYQKNTIVSGTCPNIIQFNNLCHSMVDTATKLGVGYSTVSKYVAKNNAPATVERLAGYMLRERTGKQNSNVNSLLMVRVPESKLELIKTFLKGADVRYSHFKDM